MSKFERNYRLKVKIGRLIGQTAEIDEIITIEYPLTINFSITRSTYAQASTASFEILNLNETTRAKLYKDRQDLKKYIVVEFYAGYGVDNSKLPMCFAGDVSECYSYKDGGSTEFKTEISTISGGINRLQFKSNFEMAANTNPKLIIERLASDMAVDIGKISPNILKQIVPAKKATPFVGNTYEVLRTYVNGHCFIDNNRLYILDDDDTITGNLMELNVDTGLMGTPKRRDSVIEATLVFEPNLELCQLLTLTSLTAPYLNSQYKVIGFSHTGTISGAVGGVCSSSVYLEVGNRVFNGV